MLLKITCIREPGFTAYGEPSRTKTGRKRKPPVYPDTAWVVFDKSACRNPYAPDFIDPQDQAAILGRFSTWEECSKEIDRLMESQCATSTP